MILLDEVVQITRGAKLCVFGQQAIGSHLAYCAMRSCIAIEGDRVRCSALMSDCLPEEFAAATSRLVLSLKSTVCPDLSTARYR